MDRIFLVGSPRSGTTLLQQIIVESFDNIYTLPETHFFSIAHPINNIKKNIGWKNLYLQGYTKKLATKLDIKYSYKYNTPLFDKKYFKGFIALIDAAAKRNQKDAWLEKTPRHLKFLDDITNVENSKFIHIVRKGEEVVSSLYDATNNHPKAWANKKKTKFQGFTLDDCIQRWNEDLNITLKYKLEENHLIIFYEDIINHLEFTKQTLANFLSMQSNLKKQTQNLLKGTNYIVENHEVWKQNNKNHNLKNRTKFQEIFSLEEQNYILDKLNKEKYNRLYEALH